jgi:Super-infection exclusion protein B
MAPDPRWLEILKASGWQMAAVAAACGLFLLIAHWGWLPPLDAWMILLAVIVCLICGFLAVASAISATLKFFPMQMWLLHWINRRRAKRAVRDYIPHMTERERTIIGYLLAKNQKTFTAASDGGYAATLISRGIICVAARNQLVDLSDMPMMIPDDVWDVLIEHKQQFPYSFTSQTRGDFERPPWRIDCEWHLDDHEE